MDIGKSFASNYMTKLATTFMLDEEINKMLYYTDVSNEDIYSLSKVKNPISELNDKKVFIDRKLDKLLTEVDVGMFINVADNSPYKQSTRVSSKFNQLTIQVGVICHKKCRKTINGIRELVILDRVKEIIAQNEDLHCIGEPEIGENIPMFAIPYYEYNGYSLLIKLEYWRV